MLKRIGRVWDAFWSDTDTQLERAIGLLHVPRLILLLPFEQSQFSVRVNAFTSLIPQQVWGIVAGLIVWRVWAGTGTKYWQSGRTGGMYCAGAHWLVLAMLSLLGDWRAMTGWYFLVLCLLPLATIVRLSPVKGAATDVG